VELTEDNLSEQSTVPITSLYDFARTGQVTSSDVEFAALNLTEQGGLELITPGGSSGAAVVGSSASSAANTPSGSSTIASSDSGGGDSSSLLQKNDDPLHRPARTRHN
jgi:hypothetical protein